MLQHINGMFAIGMSAAVWAMNAVDTRDFGMVAL